MMKAFVSGDFSCAIKHAKKCLDLNNQDIGVLWTLAECFRSLGNYKDAISYGKKAISIDPKRIDTLQLLTEVFFDLENYKCGYKYACDAVSTAKEMDENLGVYIDKLRNSLITLKIKPSYVHTAKNLLDVVLAMLGVTKIFGISEQHRHHHSYVSGNKRITLKSDYNVFWEEHKGVFDQQTGFYSLPMALSIKDIAEIQSKKRSMYKRSYEIVEYFRDNINRGFNSKETVASASISCMGKDLEAVT